MRVNRIAIALLLLATVGARLQPEVKIVVVVNSTNPVSSLSREQVAQIFLRQMVVWKNGDEVLPVDQIERAPARAAFAHDMQQQSVKALKMFWQQRIFSGEESPPPERVTDSDVLTYVRSNTGAIGYVVSGTDLGSGIKVLVIP